MTPFRLIAEQIFEEYNAIAADYDIAPFLNIDEVEQTLIDNITEDDAVRLEEDEMARMALGGFIAALMTTAGSGDEAATTH